MSAVLFLLFLTALSVIVRWSDLDADRAERDLDRRMSERHARALAITTPEAVVEGRVFRRVNVQAPNVVIRDCWIGLDVGDKDAP